MTIQTHVDQALDRVRDEQSHVDEKQTAFDAFERTVRDIPTAPQQRTHGGVGQRNDGGPATVATASPTTATQPRQDGCQAVCEAFAETIHPASTEDSDEPNSLLQTIGEELGDDVAVALVPESGGQFTATTKRAVLTASEERTQELAGTEQALEAEEQSLRAANRGITDITDWLVEANETGLTDLGFEELRARHERLTDYRTRCDRIVADRQEVLAATTGREGAIGVNHRMLVEFLYEEFPVSYPVLATVTRLDGVCADCQRTVRDHLVRRA